MSKSKILVTSATLNNKAIIAGKYPPGATVRVTAKNGELVV